MEKVEESREGHPNDHKQDKNNYPVEVGVRVWCSHRFAAESGSKVSNTLAHCQFSYPEKPCLVVYVSVAMIEDSYRGVLLCALGCWFAGLVYLTAQEGAEDTSIPETQAPIQAQPVHPGAPGEVPTDTTIPEGEPTFATDRPMTPGVSGPGANPPPAPMQPSTQA